MRVEIPTWVAVVIIVVVILIAAFAIWRGTGVQKIQETESPMEKAAKYGAPGVMAPGGAQPTQPTQPGAQPTQPAPSGQ